MTKDWTPFLETLSSLRLPILTLFSLCIFAEALWAWRHGKRIHHPRETASNLLILVVGQATRLLLMGYQLFWIALGESLAPWHLAGSGLALVLTLVVVDLAYYWEHRFLHKVPALWALHEVHHSSPWFNLTTSFRLNWATPLIGGPFYFVLTWLGLPGDYVMGALALNLLYQFFLHSEAVGRIPWLEGILNTPSAHRVHHGRNPEYVDKNFGGVLIIWDRLFGTYEPERAPVRYGVEAGFISHNPFRVMLHGVSDWRRNRWPELKRLWRASAGR